MTDIGRPAQFAPAHTQLPAHSYFSEDLFALEQARVFAQTARYVGHEQQVPQPGDWRALAQEDNGRVLVHGQEGVQLLSNVCRHRQALILGFGGQDRCSQHGNLQRTGGNIVCPLHRWTYTPSGKLLGAPKFAQNPKLDLQTFPLKNCRGLLFEGVRDPMQDLAALFERPEFDWSDFVLDHVQIHPCNYNWKTFIEVYLEDYHVSPFHPGLGRFVSCEDLSWEFADWYSLQRVGVHRALGSPGSPVYRAWQQCLLDYRNGKAPDFGAIWVVYFPGHMIEIYPHALVLSTLYPVSPQRTVNVVEFHYPRNIARHHRDFVQAQQAAYMETAIEDDEIAERMDAGRHALMRRGVDEAGPYQSPLEDGMLHFHAWYRRMMGMPEQEN